MINRRQRRPVRHMGLVLAALGIATALLAARLNLPRPPVARLPSQASSSPTPAPSPTPTPLSHGAPTTSARVSKSEDALAAARRDEEDGYYDEALTAYRALLSDFPNAPETTEASYRVAEVLRKQKDYRAAAAAFQDFLTAHPSDARAPAATFLLGTVYEALGENDKMLDAYRRYAQLAGPLAPYAALKLADVYSQEGDLSSVVAVLQHADADDLPPATRVDILTRLGRAYEDSGSYAKALDSYGKAQALAGDSAQQASLDYRIALVSSKAGDTTKAVDTSLRLLSRYADSAVAVRALALLDGLAPEATAPFTRGLVLYYSGQYAPAVEDFAQQIDTAPDSPLAPEARYYAGRAHQAAGEYEDAVAVFDRLMTTYPNSPRAPEASLQKGKSLAQLGQSTAALEAYAQTVQSYPQSAAAIEAFWRSAQLLEDEGMFAEAAARYGDFAAAHPQDHRASEGLFRQGFLLWRINENRRAVAVWDHLAQMDVTPEVRVQALYWAGKTLLALGSMDEAREHLQEAAGSKSDDYYAARARDVLKKRFGLSISPTASSVDDGGSELANLEKWATKLAGRPNAKVVGSVEEITVKLRRDLPFRRAEQLLAIGERQEAIREFDFAARSHRTDPLWLVRYAVYARQHGLHAESIVSALRAFSLSKLSSIFDAPRGLQTLVYPNDYRDLVSTEAQRYKIDPALLLALIRQESMFEPDARSSADARGLTQVVPTTAEAIAAALGRSQFNLDDLYKPYESVAFGAFYLADQLRGFGGDVARALAAYNGGAGNATRWATSDPDAYFENIDFPETRAYVRLVSGYYEVYRQLYGR